VSEAELMTCFTVFEKIEAAALRQAGRD
jgi:hypothetical protein